MFVSGIWVNKKPVEVDYSPWLGPDYKQKYKKDVTAPIVISNHVTHLDATIVYAFGGFPCFTADSIFAKMFPHNYFANI